MKKDNLNKFDLIDKSDDLQAQISNLKNANLEQTQIIDELTSELNDYKIKEASISSALICANEKAQQIESSSKKLYQIEISRLRLLYMKLEKTINELQNRYPELKEDKRLNDVAEQFKTAVIKEFEKEEPTFSFKPAFVPVAEDPIKKMLSNISRFYEKSNKKDEIKRKPENENNSGSDLRKNELENLSVHKDDKTITNTFDLKEALRPTQSLEDILKDFDIDDESD